MKLWMDDIRPAPEGYFWCKKVIEAKQIIKYYETNSSWIDKIELIDIDDDAGCYAEHYGGDYIKLLDWLEETGRDYPIRIHSMNPVGVENMRRIIRKNGWEEVL